MAESNTMNRSTQSGAPMRRGPGGGGPMGGMGGGKAKDMKGALLSLLSYCKSQTGIIALALVLAAAGAVFTIIGPDQLSRLTDYIYEGLYGGVSSEDMAEDIQEQSIQGGWRMEFRRKSCRNCWDTRQLK
ncbi:MAG: hypothetical protein LUI13_09335 [Lachnospiraceae bacterium]|nr:hypothetical protein [Lachnospiraceae bacterium]